MHVNVDEAGGDDLAGGIDQAIRFGLCRADPRDFSIFNQNIQFSVDTVGRVNDMTAKNQSFHGFHNLMFVSCFHYNTQKTKVLSQYCQKVCK